MFSDTAREFAETIDASIAARTYTRGELFVRAVQRAVRPHGQVLDYGCGPGRLAHLIAEQGYRVHGLDPSPAMIAEAVRQDIDGLGVLFEVGGGGEARRGGGYDGIVCSSVIEYVPDPEGLLEEFRRWLRPEGALIISFANRVSLWRRYAQWRFGQTAPHYRFQCNVYTARAFLALLERAGFSVTSAPVFFEVPPLDKRPYLAFLSRSPLIGTLGLVVSQRL